MREFKVVDVCLGDVSIPDAVGLVFSYDTMKAMHGPDTEVGPWNAAGERQVKYDYDVSNVHHPFKRLRPLHTRFPPRTYLYYREIPVFLSYAEQGHGLGHVGEP